MSHARIVVEDLSVVFRMSYDKTDTFAGFVGQKLRYFKGRRPQYFSALSEINLRIEEGEIVGVVGSNGSGKSTLLRTISGIYRPDCGTVRTNGTVSALLSLGTGFDVRLSGLDNIRLLGLIHGLTLAQIETLIPRIAEFADIGEFIGRPMKYYSSGMIARLSFSMILAIEPEILLIDETLSVGDLAFQEKSKAAMRELMNKARCQMIVSHDLDLLGRIATRVIWIEQGRLMMDGPSADIIAQYSHHMNQVASGLIARLGSE